MKLYTNVISKTAIAANSPSTYSNKRASGEKRHMNNLLQVSESA